MEDYAFKSPKSRRLFDFLRDAYVKDDEVLRIPLDRCGWRSLVQIAEGTGSAPNTLYGKRPGHIGSDIQDLIADGLIEMRYFEGERGRGGEVMRFRVYDSKARGQLRKKAKTADDIEHQTLATTNAPEISHQDKQLAEPERRHLATVMFTDMVGYTAIGQKDESLSLALIQESDRLLRPIFQRHGGSIVKTVGDAFLVQFPDALSGVRCGYDIQRASREFNIALPAEKRFSLRIGIHLGDVVESGGDIFGDAVNIASRVQSLADSGGVCLSRQVYDQVRNRIDLKFTSLGENSLKNVELPIEIYKVEFPWSESKSESIGVENFKVAVLPFTNLSPDPNDSYFADGMTEEVISTISRIPALTVISRTSSMKYKNSSKSSTEIGKELGAGKILEGSVRKSGKKLRITTQLIDSVRDTHLWTESYDKQLEDVFAIQSEIAQKVAAVLEIKLLSKEKKEIQSNLPTKNNAAYVLYLKGRYYFNERNREAVEKAVRYFEKAIELDREFGLAYGALAECYVVYADYAWLTPGEAYRRVKEYSRQAIKLDHRLAQPHASLGIVLANYDYNWNEGETELREAIELNPSYATAYHWLSLILRSEGKFDESYTNIMRARELDPLSRVIELNVGEVLLTIGKTSEAISKLEKLAEENQDYAFAYIWLGWGYYMASRQEEAVNTLRKSVTISGEDPMYKAHLACLFGLSGKPAEANVILEELLLLSRTKDIDSGQIAYALFGAGRIDEAFARLEKAYEERSNIIPYLNWWPWFREKKIDPRFSEFMKKVGLEAHAPMTEPPPQKDNRDPDKLGDRPDTRRIAVLPFANISPDPDDDYFADGLTEELISKLSLVKGLRVIAHTSIVKFKGRENEVTEIGKQLRVDTLLGGSVRKSGNQVRLVTRLFDATRNILLWTGSYDSDLEGIFAVQSDVTENIAQSLKIRLLGAEKSLPKEGKPTENSEAYVYYIRGLYFLQKHNHPDYRKARELFEKAIELDPTYAAAIARLASCYCSMGYFGFESPGEAYAKAGELAVKALKLDDSIPEAHFAMGRVSFYAGDWDAWRDELAKAIELNPSYSEAHTLYSRYLASFGHTEEAIVEARKGAELNPLSPASRAHVGTTLQICGRDVEAIAEFEKAIEMDENFPFIHNDLGLSKIYLGRIDEGVKSLEKAVELSGRSSFCLSNLAFGYCKAGRIDDAFTILSELLGLRKRQRINGLFLSQVYAALGKNSEALDWLEIAYQEGTVIGDPLLNIDPIHSSLRNEPRFRTLLAKLRLQLPEERGQKNAMLPSPIFDPLGDLRESTRVAVLPFANTSNDSEDEYFADGLTEELIGLLSQVKGLEVIARTSVMAYKRKDAKKTSDIGKELHTSTFVEGSVRKLGNKIRVAAILVNAETGRHLWSCTYDRNLEDIFEIQGDIASKVAELIPAKPHLNQLPLTVERDTGNIAAYSEFLRARELLHETAENKIRDALTLFDSSIRRDPSFARAYVGKALCYRSLGLYAHISYLQAIQWGRVSIDKALAINDKLAEAHAALAVIEWMADNMRGAEAAAKRAIELNPNLAEAYESLADCKASVGEIEESIKLREKAYQLDPLEPWNLTSLGDEYFWTGRDSDALNIWETSMKLAPYITCDSLMEYYLSKGDYLKAQETIIRLQQLEPNNPETDFWAAYLAAVEGDSEKAKKWIEAVSGSSKNDTVTVNGIGLIYFALGDLDRFFEQMRKSSEVHTLSDHILRYSPLLAKVRNDPRMRKLLAGNSGSNGN